MANDDLIIKTASKDINPMTFRKSREEKVPKHYSQRIFMNFLINILFLQTFLQFQPNPNINCIVFQSEKVEKKSSNTKTQINYKVNLKFRNFYLILDFIYWPIRLGKVL